MLVNRIIGALTFRKGVYAEVENDPSFTSTAWILVVVIAFLNQIGAQAQAGSIVNWLVGAVIGTIVAVIGFAVAAFVVNWAGRTFYDAEVTFEELVRTLGLAYVWQAVGLLGILGAISAVLTCVIAPVLLIAFILLIVAWFVAAKEALDLSWGQTIVTVVAGWLALFVITAIGAAIIGLLGFGASAVGGALGL